MADKLDPTINMLLNNPNLFKMPARTPGQESSSSAQGSAAQPETNLKITTMGLKSWGNTVDASKAGVDNVGDSEQTIPDKFSVSELSDGYKGAHPDFGGGSASPEYSGSEFDHDSDAEAGTPSKSKEGKAEPSLSELMKLAEEYDESPDQESQQSLADLLLELPAPLNESSAKRSTSPPLDHALARRASILGYKKPSASRLRNEIHDSSADDDKLAQTKGKKLLANVDFQKQPHASEERATDGKATSSFGNSIDTERADELAAFAHLLPKSKAYREGITKEKTTQSWVERTRLVQGIMLQESVADKDSLIPPIVLLNGAPETTDFMVRIPTPSGQDQLPQLRFRELGDGLSVDEWRKVPHEFRHFHQLTLAKFWDLAYDPIVRKTVLNYKRKLALAGEADKVFDWANRLLAALVDIQEADIDKAVKGTVDASNLKTSEPQKAGPSYDTTTALGRTALLKGVKPHSQLTATLTDFYKELQTFHNSSKMATTPSKKQTIMLPEPGRLSQTVTLATEDLPLEDQATAKGKGKENDLPVTDTTISKGKGKRKGNSKGKDRGKGKEKGKGKESEPLMEGPATSTAKGKEGGLPVKYLTISKDGVRESDHTEASRRKADSDILHKAKKLFLGPKADEFRKAMSMVISADPHDPRGIFQSPLTMEEAANLIGFQRVYDIMETMIRPQVVQLAQVELLCTLFVEPEIFAAMSVVIEELNWDRAIVKHPTNPLITCILQCTAHLRPTNDPQHSSGSSVAPPLTPQYPPLPPGPPSTTALATEHTNEQSRKKQRACIPVLEKVHIPVQLPFESAMKLLELREETIVAKMKNGESLRSAEVMADFYTIGLARQYLTEKARLDQSGGKVADMLAERQKTMAEQDGAPTDLLP